MPQMYEPEFKKKIVRLHVEEGHTYQSITAEYGVAKSSISKWCSEFSDECQKQAQSESNSNPESLNDWEMMKENHILRKQLEDAQKEIAFLKKAEIMEKIQKIYHEHNGVDGYRRMRVYLERAGYPLSSLTVHKYMNKELGLVSVVRPKKPRYVQGQSHKTFENKLAQDFHSEKSNQKWCTDFTYLRLKNGELRYNCSILNLHDRSIVASITDREITSDLAIRTLQKALDSQPSLKGELLVHSDQGTQYTSKAFTEFCEKMHDAKYE